MRNFKFFKGIIGARVVSVGGTLNEINEPPYGISRRHWNMLPQDLRGGTQRHMEVYIEGWEAYRNNITISPYAGIWDPEFNELNHLWNRGYIISSNRRTRTYTERDMEYYHTEDFLFFDVSEVRYNMNGRPYKVMLYRHIEEGNTVEGQIIYQDHYMYNFPDVI